MNTILFFANGSIAREISHGAIDLDDPHTQEYIDQYSDLILGVANATTLDDEQKDFMIELLEDQLNRELECLAVFNG